MVRFRLAFGCFSRFSPSIEVSRSVLCDAKDVSKDSLASSEGEETCVERSCGSLAKGGGVDSMVGG